MMMLNAILAVLVSLHRYGNLCLMPRYSSRALVSLAPKRKQGCYTHWRPPGVNRHGSHHKSLVRFASP